jgi:ABC-type phosphate transport system permease subunit
MEAHGTMKKTFAYAIIAALFGVAVMLVPFFTVPSLVSELSGEGNTYRTPLSPTQSLAPANTQAAAKQSELSAGVVPNYPVDALTVTLIVLFSLAVAFSAYVYRRRSRFLRGKNMRL